MCQRLAEVCGQPNHILPCCTFGSRGRESSAMRQGEGTENFHEANLVFANPLILTIQKRNCNLCNGISKLPSACKRCSLPGTRQTWSYLKAQRHHFIPYNITRLRWLHQRMQRSCKWHRWNGSSLSRETRSSLSHSANKGAAESLAQSSSLPVGRANLWIQAVLWVFLFQWILRKRGKIAVSK